MAKHRGLNAVKITARVVNKTAGRALEQGAIEVGHIVYGVVDGFLNILSGNSLHHKPKDKHKREHR
jgi:hypothetical protein